MPWWPLRLFSPFLHTHQAKPRTDRDSGVPRFDIVPPWSLRLRSQTGRGWEFHVDHRAVCVRDMNRTGRGIRYAFLENFFEEPQRKERQCDLDLGILRTCRSRPSAREVSGIAFSSYRCAQPLDNTRKLPPRGKVHSRAKRVEPRPLRACLEAVHVRAICKPCATAGDHHHIFPLIAQ